MSFQAYLDNIKAKTGKTPDDFRILAAKKGLVKHGEIIAWLKSDFGLGHGHANAIAHVIEHHGKPKVSANDAVAAHFVGNKTRWRKPYAALITKATKFGADVAIGPGKTYISLLRGSKKFGIVQVSAAERLDIGIKLKGVKPAGRLEAAGSWNAMVTHRVRITDPKHADKEALAWLKQAYDAAEEESLMKLKQRDQQEGDLPKELAQPARRALAAAGIQRLTQLTKLSEDEIKQLHGIGPNALEQLRRALSAKGLSYAAGKRKKG